jgi:cytochrome c peroxidase
MLGVVVQLGCAGDGHGALDPFSGNPADFSWNLPAGMPEPRIPADNPMSPAKVELGRRLFYDTRLSANGAFSCSSCHRQEFAFADAKNIPLGSTGEPHPRNSMALANIAYQPSLGWANPETRSLEAQARIPMFGQHPVELGLHGLEADLLARLRTEPRYQALFPRSFPGPNDPFTIDNVTRAIAAFERTFIALDAPYDRFVRGDVNAIGASAKRGEALFRSERLKCDECHSGVLFTNAGDPERSSSQDPEFFNTGLYNVGGNGAYPSNNTGLFEHTFKAGDMGRFKVPSLRNVSLTFPYMHDGSVATLEDALDHYARGGRVIALGPNAGDGSRSQLKDARVAGFTITAQEKGDVVAFLKSLTDSAFVLNARLSNPWR